MEVVKNIYRTHTCGELNILARNEEKVNIFHYNCKATYARLQRN